MAVGSGSSGAGGMGYSLPKPPGGRRPLDSNRAWLSLLTSQARHSSGLGLEMVSLELALRNGVLFVQC